MFTWQHPDSGDTMYELPLLRQPESSAQHPQCPVDRGRGHVLFRILLSSNELLPAMVNEFFDKRLIDPIQPRVGQRSERQQVRHLLLVILSRAGIVERHYE
jgi:hypothetical protein